MEISNGITLRMKSCGKIDESSSSVSPKFGTNARRKFFTTNGTVKKRKGILPSSNTIEILNSSSLSRLETPKPDSFLAEEKKSTKTCDGRKKYHRFVGNTVTKLKKKPLTKKNKKISFNENEEVKEPSLFLDSDEEFSDDDD